MADHVTVINLFQKTAAVFDGSDIDFISVPEIGVLQAIVLPGVGKIMFFNEFVYFFHAILMFMRVAEIADQLIGGFVVTETDHVT